MKFQTKEGSIHMAGFKFGRTANNKPSFFDKLKGLNIEKIKSFNFRDLTPQQRKKVVFGSIIFFILLGLIGLFSQNNQEAYKSTINDFLKYSSQYDVQATAKTTTSTAHQLIVSQNAKIKETKAKNFKTTIDNVDTKIVSEKGNSIIGTSKVRTTEQIGSEPPKEFMHLFIFHGQKTGATWKIGNLLEAEAKLTDNLKTTEVKE